MAKNKSSGCAAIIGLIIVIALIATFSKVIGIALIIGAILYGLYLLGNKDTFSTYSNTRKVVSIAAIIIVFFLGASLAFPSSDKAKNDVSKNDTKQFVQEDNSSSETVASVIISTDKSKEREGENKEDETVTNNTESEEDKEFQEIYLETATVTKHVDGDTVYVKLEDRQEYKVRFIGVDTPETVHPSKPVEFYGKEASDFTESKLLGQTVYLEKDVSDTDKYDRLLRYIWLEPPAEISKEEIKSKMFNAILVANGYAQVSTYPPDVKYQDYFLEFEREARNKDVGLWDKLAEEETVQTTSTSSGSSNTSGGSGQGNSFEDKSDTDKSYDYMGNSNSMKFHETTCRYAKKTSEHNRVYFQTRDEAINKDYVPCKVCNP